MNEILVELEKPTGMSSNGSAVSDEEDFDGLVKISESGVHTLYTMPSKDGAMADEDSGEEDNMGISNLPASQLTASATIGSAETEDNTHENVETKGECKKRTKIRERKEECEMRKKIKPKHRKEECDKRKKIKP